jgi:hypothetical protein
MQTFSVDRIVHSCSSDAIGYVPLHQSVVAENAHDALDLAQKEWPDMLLRVQPL